MQMKKRRNKNANKYTSIVYVYSVSVNENMNKFNSRSTDFVVIERKLLLTENLCDNNFFFVFVMNSCSVIFLIYKHQFSYDREKTNHKYFYFVSIFFSILISSIELWSGRATDREQKTKCIFAKQK